MRPLHRLRAEDPISIKAQCFVAAARGPEGQSCHNKAWRVYTWNAKRERYEPALNENNLCGKHPIRFGFFQAEDGIRDLTVTGVQTCALPIWRKCGRSATKPSRNATRNCGSRFRTS